MYVFNKITVTPQLPTKINKLSTVADNLWWSWNTDFLKLFKKIDGDLWEKVNKNPVKLDTTREIYDFLMENKRKNEESKNR